jgi:hypothetical protein
MSEKFHESGSAVRKEWGVVEGFDIICEKALYASPRPLGSLQSDRRERVGVLVIECWERLVGVI